MTTTTAKTTTKISTIDEDTNVIGSDRLPTQNNDKKPIPGISNEKPTKKPTTTTTTSGNSEDIDCTNKDYVASSDCTKVN